MGVGSGVGVTAGVGVRAAGDSEEEACAAGVGERAADSFVVFESVHAPSAHASASVTDVVKKFRLFMVLIKEAHASCVQVRVGALAARGTRALLRLVPLLSSAS
jgi:hypothetical protein